jgi:gas vesicle protein
MGCECALLPVSPFASIQTIAHSSTARRREEMDQQETTGIGWFVAGLGLGALLGVLFAPKSGREIRDGLVSSARDKKEYVAARGKQARDQINSVVDKGRDQINEYTEKGKEAAEKGRERWSGIVDRVAGNQSESERRAMRDDDPEAYRGGTAETHF